MNRFEKKAINDLVYDIQDKLSVSYIPDILPCRTDAFNKLKKQISAAAKMRRNLTIFVSGVPGTGKTATVKKVLESIKVDSYFINAMQCPLPSKIHSIIYKEITGKKLPPSSALIEMNSLVKNLKTPTVIVIDEVDMLLTKDERVLYAISDWATMGTPLSLILLANTVDLFQNAMPRINSRAGATTYDFKPYDYNELKTIVQQRITVACERDDLVSEAAYKIALTPIAQTLGDARKALHLVSMCFEKARLESLNSAKPLLVTPKIVSQQRREMNVNNTSKFIQSLPEVPARILYHLSKRTMSSSTGEILWDHLASDVAYSMSMNSKILTTETLLLGLSDLKECGFINAPSNPFPFDVVAMSDYIDASDTLIALQETSFGEKYFL